MKSNCMYETEELKGQSQRTKMLVVKFMTFLSAVFESR